MTFITEVQKEDGLYEGPEINAPSWAEAEDEARKQGVILVGELG